MKLAFIAALLAAAASATPAPKVWRDEKRGLEIRGLGDQGDGFYGVAFDANGVGKVQFTPWAKLNHTGEVEETAAIQAAIEANANATAAAGLSKRDGYSTCQNEWANWQHLDIANVQLARNSNNGGPGRDDYFPRHWWGWVHHEGVTSYFCPYDNLVLGYNLVIDCHIRLSNDCGGSSALGWFRGQIWPDSRWYLVGNGAVGRTYRGRSFCTGGFYG